jgi:hypothetical protein
MTHKDRATRKSRTHFEQIPVEVVKKIVVGDVSTGKNAATDNVIVEPVARRTNRVQDASSRAEREGSGRLTRGHDDAR